MLLYCGIGAPPRIDSIGDYLVDDESVIG